MSTDYKGITIPEYAEAADGPKAFRDAVDSGPIPRFQTASDRDTAIQTPVEGLLTYIVSTHTYTKYTGSKWEDFGTGYAPLHHHHSASDITSGTVNTARLPKASTSAKGIVQLSSSHTSTSQTVAATPAAVKAAYDKASHSHPYVPLKGNSTIEGSIKITGTLRTYNVLTLPSGSSDAPTLRFDGMLADSGIYGNRYELSFGMAKQRHLTVWDPKRAAELGVGIVQLRGGSSAGPYILSGDHLGVVFKLTPKALKWLGDNHNS